MYSIDKLNYSLDALEPVLSRVTIDTHYNKHAMNYLNKLNEVLDSINYDYRYTLNELINHIDEFEIKKRDEILYNAGGVLNHQLYFNNMSPNKNILPVGKLNEAITSEFGSFENFKSEFINKANLMVGSGYTFLVINGNQKLEIINTSNQETPYVYGLTPIMTIDLWEHAYYLDYKNRRADYINNFFLIVDFNFINKLYEENIK